MQDEREEISWRGVIIILSLALLTGCGGGDNNAAESGGGTRTAARITRRAV